MSLAQGSAHLRRQPFNRVNGRQQRYALSYASPMQELPVINDYVMGGRSRSKLIPAAAGPLFGGDVSLGEGQSGPFRVELELPRAG
jgi:hypothetical protein